MDNGADRLEQARNLHLSGELGAARAAYETLLEAAPEDADLLGLLGVVALQEGRDDAAEALLRRALVAGGGARIELRNLNNLLALMQRAGREDAARELAAGGVPEWPEGETPDATERETVLSLGWALVLLGSPDAARGLLERAIPNPDGDAEALGLLGRALVGLGEAEAAVGLLERAVDLSPDDCEPLIALAHARSQLGQDAATRATIERVARRWPVFAPPQVFSQRARLLILNPGPKRPSDIAWGLHSVHFSANVMAQFSRTLNSEFQFLSVFADLPTEDLPERLPDADLIVNNCVNGETLSIPGRLERVLEALARTGASVGVPIINHPDAVVATTRQKTAELLRGIPNLKVPQIERYRVGFAPSAAVAADIEENFGYPVILRRCQAHRSSRDRSSMADVSAFLVQDAKELHEILAAVNWPEFYAIEYVPLRKKAGYFRKIRAVLAPDEVIVAIPGFGPEWSIAGARWLEGNQAFYRANPETIAQCNRMVRDPEAVLGADCLRVLEEIRGRMPLDFLGVDFDVDDTGQVVFFEANIAMNLLKHAGEPADLTLPDEPFERIKDAFRRMIDRHIAGAG